jgi:DNA-binding response OmpR family regulator
MEGRRLLIVEDNPTIRTLLERALARKGWRVESVETVAAALGKLATPPDCILLDLMLPDGDGEDVLRAINNAGLSIRVVVATACQDRQRIDGVKQLGAAAVFRMPFDVDAIHAACLGPR